MLRRVVRKVALQQWPGTDEAHLTPDDVEQLRELVEAEAANQFESRRQSLQVRQQNCQPGLWRRTWSETCRFEKVCPYNPVEVDGRRAEDPA